jgi:hypothetical protein
VYFFSRRLTLFCFCECFTARLFATRWAIIL